MSNSLHQVRKFRDFVARRFRALELASPQQAFHRDLLSLPVGMKQIWSATALSEDWPGRTSFGISSRG